MIEIRYGSRIIVWYTCFIFFARDLVQQDRDRDRKHCAQNDEGHVVQNRVARDGDGVLRLEKVGKVAETPPSRWPRMPLRQLTLLKGDDQAGHRQVPVLKEVQRTRQGTSDKAGCSGRSAATFRLRRARLHFLFQRRGFSRHGLKTPFSLILSFGIRFQKEHGHAQDAAPLCACHAPFGERTRILKRIGFSLYALRLLSEPCVELCLLLGDDRIDAGILQLLIELRKESPPGSARRRQAPCGTC